MAGLFNSMLNGSDDDEKSGGADALGGLAGMLGGGSGGDNPMDMLSGLLGGAGGDNPLGMVGGLLGGAGGGDLSQLPVVGPIIGDLAAKFGIPPAQATALLTGAMAMITGAMKDKGVDRVESIDIGGLAQKAASQTDVIERVAEEAGLDKEQAAAGVQEAMSMLEKALQQ